MKDNKIHMQCSPRVLSEALLALLACQNELDGLLERVVGRLGMALRAVEPALAAGGADRDLSVQDVLAHMDERAGRPGRVAANGTEWREQREKIQEITSLAFYTTSRSWGQNWPQLWAQ